ncbi:MAG: coproporphyrinogen-III oxidase family protein [Nocardioides sp.]
MGSVSLKDAEQYADEVLTSELAEYLPSATGTYLTGTYPPLKAMESIGADEVFAMVSTDLNVYVHIPFCLQRCTFCHFAKEIKPGRSRVTAYLDALMSELRLAAARFGGRLRARSVYFGGGTPSSLAATEMRMLFAALHDNFEIDSTTEFTFELHPQIVCDPRGAGEKLSAMRDAGVNRIAFGVQSLDDKVLRVLNRGHDGRQVFDLLRLLSEEGMTNVSVDLMYGLPDESLSSWSDTLIQLLDAGVEKFNIFPLFFKITDPISRLYERHPERFPNDRQRLAAHAYAEALLHARGFRRGPVLYYSRAERHSSQQELKFDAIDDVNLLGLGVSAFGYVGSTQYYNECSIDSYIGAADVGRMPVWRGATLDTRELARRAAMFGLRSAGLDRQAFQARFGQFPDERFPVLNGLRDQGLLECVDDVWTTTAIGAYCIDSISSLFASASVLARIEETNRGLADRRHSAIEQFDFSPLGRDELSIPRPR